MRSRRQRSIVSLIYMPIVAKHGYQWFFWIMYVFFSTTFSYRWATSLLYVWWLIIILHRLLHYYVTCWRHQKKIFSTLLALACGKIPRYTMHPSIGWDLAKSQTEFMFSKAAKLHRPRLVLGSAFPFVFNAHMFGPCRCAGGQWGQLR